MKKDIQEYDGCKMASMVFCIPCHLSVPVATNTRKSQKWENELITIDQAIAQEVVISKVIHP